MTQSHYFRRLLQLAVTCGALTLAGCTTGSNPAGQPLAKLTFDQVQKLPVNVAHVNIDNRYKPGMDLRDVSDSFPTPPDMAVEEYIHERVQPDVMSGNSTLYVVIEDMHVYQSEDKAEGFWNHWLGSNDMDHYDVFMALRLYNINDYGHESQHVRLKFDGDLDIPQRYSMARREQTQLRFLEAFMKNVDKAFVKALRDKLKVLRGGVNTSLYGAPTDTIQQEHYAPNSYDEDLRQDASPVMDEDGVYHPYGMDDNGAMEAPQSLAPPEMR